MTHLNDLPESVQQYLLDESVGDLNAQVFLKNGIADDQKPALFALFRELLSRQLTLDHLVSEIQKRMQGFDEVAARKLALDIAGYRLLPLDKWLADVDGYIRSLGGDPSAYPTDRVKIERRTPEEAAEEVVKTLLPFEVFDVRLKGRLEDLLKSHFAGIRNEPQVAEALQRSDKVGGIGLSDEAAAMIMEEAREESRAVWITHEQEEPPNEPAAQEGQRSVSFVTITAEDDAEIEAVKAKLEHPSTDTSAVTAQKIAASVDELYAASGIVPPTEDLQKRLKTIIGNRLRDVRDQMETLETLVQPKELGGMSLPQDDARKLLALIEKKLRDVHEAHAGQVTAQKAEWAMKETNEKIRKEQEASMNEQAQLARLYHNIVAKSPKAAAAAAPDVSFIPGAHELNLAAAPPPEPAIPPGAAPMNLPVVESAPPRTAPAPMQVPIMVAPPVAAPAAMQPKTLVRPVAVPPEVPATRPVMQDIRPSAPRLTGPVEELRATTLTDFRRLSKEPKDACAKIKDKIDILGQQSFEKRTEGLKAWSESEVYRTYLEMMREALDGKPMAQVIADRGAAKQSALTQQEVQAVADLSRNLRY